MPDEPSLPPAPAPPLPEGRPVLTGLPLQDLEALLASWGEPRYRAEQVFRALWREGIPDPAGMSTLPRSLRERLARETVPSAVAPLEEQVSADGTTKWLLALADGRRVEAVLIPEGERRTVCVSTQVGCPIRCVFCASGVGGLVRDLTAAEIAEQVLVARRRAGDRPTNLVVMGMGEPLANLGNLAPAVRIWQEPAGLDFSPRRITVSTAATPGLVDRLLEADLGVHLAISLHGADDETRSRLVPTSGAGRVAGLVEAAARYARRTGRDATVEFVLIRGENDSPEQADDLAEHLRGRHLHVNLIPMNPVGHRPDLAAPDAATAEAFARRLRERGVSVTLRARRGSDIAAACGQLAMERAGGAPAPHDPRPFLA